MLESSYTTNARQCCCVDVLFNFQQIYSFRPLFYQLVAFPIDFLHDKDSTFYLEHLSIEVKKKYQIKVTTNLSTELTSQLGAGHYVGSK